MSELLNEYKRKMKTLNKNKDWEVEHAEGDKLLCELLEQLGFGEVVQEWKKIGKWYV